MSLEQLVARYARHGHSFSLILGDLDKFKRVNDSYGHNVGDGVLIETASRLQDHVRAGDIVSAGKGKSCLWFCRTPSWAALWRSQPRGECQTRS